ncbi:MAG TPA: hypothetical protein VIU33_02665, partial [Nitrospiria bacterium]
RQLLIYAQGRDPSKIEKVLEAARPLTTHLKSRYGTDIESVFLNAMASQKWERMVPASRHLVYLDTLDLMESAVESLRKASPEAKNRMKAAFMNYLLLAPYLKSIDSPADEAIRGHFRHAGKLIASSEDLRQTSVTVQDITRKIDIEMKTALSLED